ncbi:MAG: HdeD family acid-resistance protein [Nocardioides sp.]
MSESSASTTTPSDAPTGVPQSMTRLVDHWGLVLTYGLITIGLGLVLVLWPEQTLKVLAILIGIQLVITGVFRLVLAVASRRADGSTRALAALFGALALVLGLLCLRSPLQTVLVIGMLLGVWWLAAGVIDIVGAIRSSESQGRGWDLAKGALSAVAGGFLLVNPEVSLGVLVIVVAVWMFSYGFIAVVGALVLRGEEKRTSSAPVSGATQPAT